jgi:hypothetical protein
MSVTKAKERGKMNMYRDSYVVAMLVNGRILKEDQGGTVLVPFGAEYVIRLKNKLRKRAVADVWIDGRVACRGIVIDANGTVDLERFVDGNLTEGRRFKLVRTTDSRVAQPNDSENGIVEVNFYPEKDQPVVNTVVNTVVHHEHHGHGHCSKCCHDWWCNICHPRAVFGNFLSSSERLGSSFSAESTLSKGITRSDGPVAMNMCSVSASMPTPDIAETQTASKETGEAAATVEGSQSFQRFSSVYIDYDRDHPVTIRMILRGVDQILDVCHCGFKRSQEKFCPSCGTQLAA